MDQEEGWREETRLKEIRAIEVTSKYTARKHAQEVQFHSLQNKIKMNSKIIYY